MNQQERTFIARIIKVHKILLPVLRQSRRVNSIAMILASDMAFACCEIQGRNIVCTVAILEFDGLGTSSESDQLVTQADAHNRDLRRVH